jgi:hypothetical protein
MCIQIHWGKAINKLARRIGDATRVKGVPVRALSAAVSDPAGGNAGIHTVLAPVTDSAAEDPAIVVNALLASGSAGESTAQAAAEAALQPLASDATPPEMQEGDPSLTVVEPRNEVRRYLIDRTARYMFHIDLNRLLTNVLVDLINTM